MCLPVLEITKVKFMRIIRGKQPVTFAECQRSLSLFRYRCNKNMDKEDWARFQVCNWKDYMKTEWSPWSSFSLCLFVTQWSNRIISSVSFFMFIFRIALKKEPPCQMFLFFRWGGMSLSFYIHGSKIYRHKFSISLRFVHLEAGSDSARLSPRFENTQSW